MTIELDKVSSEYDDELTMILENGMLIVYESRQCEMKIFQNDKLVYYTPHNTLPRVSELKSWYSVVD
jgi:hypothetical protein